MNLPLSITIAIPIKNEELHLQGCLDAIGKDFAEKVIIIDSGSSDSSLAIAERNGIEIIDFKWNGLYPKKRNWFLQNYPLKTKWVFFLDADEYLTEDFKREIAVRINKVHDDIDGFWLTYTRYFLGKRLKGGYPLKKLAFFKVGAGEYERIAENNWSALDMEIHEHPVLAGKTLTIKNEIDHLDFRGIAHYLAKHNEYSSWETERILNNLSDRSVGNEWTWKQKIKYKFIFSPFMAPAFFIISYFFLGGLRDGKRGLAFAILKASYFTSIYCKLQERVAGNTQI